MNITFPARVPTKESSLFKSKLVWIITGVVGFVFLLVVITTILLLRFVYVQGKKNRFNSFAFSIWWMILPLTWVLNKRIYV